MKIIKITIAALLVLAVAALAGVGRPEAAGGASEDSNEGITVTGSGDMNATPDRADLSFSVQSEGSTAAQALATNSADSQRLIDALKAAGVQAKDLKTEHLDVSPRYDVDKVTELRGYSASSSVSVRSQPLDRAARLSDVAVRAGADSVSGPSLSVADRDARYRRALERAFDDARAKAEGLAAAAGVSLGEVTAIVEGGQPRDFPIYATAERALDAKTPIEPGSEEITASVTVTFALR
ncbi:MAG TPA: SIMPL domain-containing protein [Gaiellaceae bacterium]|nr:SIMPL domain-containing protein [Gaiellaceae bacterium]